MSLGQDDRDPTGRFVRGLTLGAMLGAIIAGSSIWSRARARRRPTGRTAEAAERLPEPALSAEPVANEPD